MWVSTNPGVTHLPSASTTRVPAETGRGSGLTAATTPARIPTSARTPGAPVPSNTVPPRITTSKSVPPGLVWCVVSTRHSLT